MPLKPLPEFNAIRDRFIQLPTDGEREAQHGKTRQHVKKECLPFTRAPKAVQVAALAALFHRFSGQDCIEFDLIDHEGIRPLSLQLEAEMPWQQLVFHADEVLSAPPRMAPRSNVSLYLRDSGTKDVNAELNFSVTGNGLEVDFDASLFQPETVERILNSLEVLLAAGDGTFETLPVMAAGDLHEVQAALVGSQSGGGLGTVLDDYQACVAEHRDSVAVRATGISLTYGELDRRANQLAHYMLSCGIGRGSTVAVCIKPGPDSVVAILAIFKTRSVYLPLDPSYPPALLATMAEEAKPVLVLTHHPVQASTTDLGAPQVCLDTQ
jgi:non-ribosomal peptide synthetase component F